MNRSELVRAVCEQTGLPKSDVESILDSTCSMIASALACGEHVTIHHFGRFEPRNRREVTRKHPGTGEDITVPAKRSVLFRPSPHMKDRINL